MPIILAMLLAWMPWFLVIGGALYVGMRIVRALEHRPAAGDENTELRAQVTRLESRLADSEAEIVRLREAEDFTSRLLSERRAPDSTSGAT